MRGAIVGDIVGSIWEGSPSGARIDRMVRPKSRFTDDTICTIAIADAILEERPFGEALRDWCGRYPNIGYGGKFQSWLRGGLQDGYGSFGNGAPMRVSPCAWLGRGRSDVLTLANASCIPTHNHETAQKAAEAVCLAILVGRSGGTKEEIRKAVVAKLGDDIPAVAAIAELDEFDVVADSTVLAAVACVLEAEAFEDVLLKAVFCGGDVDTIASIAGAIAEPLFGIPETLWLEAAARLPDDVLGVIARFDACVSAGGRALPLAERLGFKKGFHEKAGPAPAQKRNAWGYIVD